MRGVLENDVTTAGQYTEDAMQKLPTDTFLWLSGASIAASLTLKFMGRDRDALFVGQWAPTFLILGVYNKVIKQFLH